MASSPPAHSVKGAWRADTLKGALHQEDVHFTIVNEQ